MIGNVTERVDVALSTLEDRGRQANERIEDIRNSARLLDERVQQRVAELRDIPTEATLDIDEIERQLYARIQLGKDWIGFIKFGVDLVEQFLQMLNSTSLFLQEESKTRADVLAAMRGGHEKIDEAFRLSDEVRTHVENIRAHRNLDESARQIRTLSSRIEALLENVQHYGEDFEAAIVQLRTDAANLGTRIRRQLLVVAVIANLILIWLATSQVSLAIHGWRLLRSRLYARDGAI
jgi:prefoldin subunit 5